MGLPALDPSKRDLEIVEDGIKGPTLDHVRHLHLNPLQCFLLPSLASRSPRATLVASTPARPSVPSRRCAVTTRIERALGRCSWTRPARARFKVSHLLTHAPLPMSTDG